MKYNINLTIEELSLIKCALSDYYQRTSDNVISANMLSEKSTDFKEKEEYDRLSMSNRLTCHDIICLMGKLQNIIPIANKITEENEYGIK